MIYVMIFEKILSGGLEVSFSIVGNTKQILFCIVVFSIYPTCSNGYEIHFEKAN